MRRFSLILVLCLLSLNLHPTNAQESGVHVTELTPLGRGSIFDLAYSEDGSQIITDNTTGTWVYDANDLSQSTRIGAERVLPDYSDTANISITNRLGTYTVKYNLDDRYSYTEEPNVIIIDNHRKTEIAELVTHREFLNDMAIHPDLPLLAYISYTPPDISDLKAKYGIWNFITGEIIPFSTRYARSVATIEFTPDGKFLALGHSAGISFWELETQQESHAFIRDIEGVFEISIHPDGNQIVTLDRNYQLKLWDKEQRTLIDISQPQPWWLTEVAVHPDQDFVAALNRYSGIYVWDANTNAQVFSENMFLDTAREIAFSPDGQKLYVSGDTNIFVWSVGDWQPLPPIMIPYVNNIVPSPTENMIAINDGSHVILWDTVNDIEIRRFEGHTESVHAIAFYPDGTKIVSTSGESSNILVWDVNTLERIGEAALPDTETAISELTVSDDGCWIAGTGIFSSSDVFFWDGGDFSFESATIIGHGNYGNLGMGIAFYPNTNRLISNQNVEPLPKNVIVLISPSTGEETEAVTEAFIQTQYLTINDIVLSRDKTRLYAPTLDGIIRRWDIEIPPQNSTQTCLNNE